MWSNGRSESALEALLPVPVTVRRIRNARRLRLRFDEAAGVLKLTCPWRTSRKSALRWAAAQRDWIDSQIAAQHPAAPLVAGGIIPLEGREIRIIWNERAPRIPQLVGNELHCGGTEAGLARRVEKFLKARALSAISGDVAEYASLAGATPTRLTVGDAATRWGSCSSKGAIRISWRLILAPPEVRRFVAAHEVAHLVHLNHGPEFRALESALFGPGLGEAKALLRRVGPRLRRVGRSA